VWLDYPYAQDDKVKEYLIIFNKADKDGVSNYYNEELKLVVVARPVFKQKSAQSPLTGIDSALKKAKEQYQEKTDGLRTVVLAHGSVDFSGKSTNYPIKKEEITALGADYLALGDWHGVLDVSQSEQIAYYPGALEFTQSDQERAGHALLVELLDDNKPNVKQLKVSKLSLMNKEYNLEQQRLDSIIKEIASLANENLMLSITLTGSRSENERLVELESQFSDLNNLFYYFKLRDKTQSIIHSTKLDQYPQNSVPHEFIRLVKLKLDKKEIDQQTAEKVMRLGLGAILSDKHN
jgi:DNA repair exonuclease SbcCD nuclease subunit